MQDRIEALWLLLDTEIGTWPPATLAARWEQLRPWWAEQLVSIKDSTALFKLNQLQRVKWCISTQLAELQASNSGPNPAPNPALNPGPNPGPTAARQKLPEANRGMCSNCLQPVLVSQPRIKTEGGYIHGRCSHAEVQTIVFTEQSLGIQAAAPLLLPCCCLAELCRLDQKVLLTSQSPNPNCTGLTHI